MKPRHYAKYICLALERDNRAEAERIYRSVPDHMKDMVTTHINNWKATHDQRKPGKP